MDRHIPSQGFISNDWPAGGGYAGSMLCQAVACGVYTIGGERLRLKAAVSAGDRYAHTTLMLR